MIILAIETSCDDTGIAVIKKKGEFPVCIASSLSSQEEIHKKWGGVHPSEAKRAHQKTLVPLLEETLKKANLLEKGRTINVPNLEEIMPREKELQEELEEFFGNYKIKELHAIAVTVGPGLEPCLFVGVNFARAIAAALSIPLIPVNHIKAHILTFLLENKTINFPAVALVASGGHTEIVLMEDMESYKLLGKTRDDAAGECFDKTARILGLPYPGGPMIAAAAAKFSISNFAHSAKATSATKAGQFSIKLPRPMMHSKNYDFSFSGLKTAVLYDFLSRDKKTQKEDRYIGEMAKEIEEAITDVLVFKLQKAAIDHNARTLILGGGVIANKLLQKKACAMARQIGGVNLMLPSPSLSTDNAQMIGAAAILEKNKVTPNTIKVDANLKIYPSKSAEI